MRRASQNYSIRAGRGFTLVELLVVIGIIGLLLAVLLPTLRRARQQAAQVQCLSNLHQLGMAVMMFTNEHHYQMPAAAGFSLYKVDPLTGKVVQITSSADPFVKNPADWIAWQRIKDQFTGKSTSASNQNITYSALAPYLGAHYVETKTGDQANAASPGLDAIFRCPADALLSRDSHADTSHGYYYYSYAMNAAYCNPVTAFNNIAAGGKFALGLRVDGTFNGKVNTIFTPSRKVLLICEDDKTLDNGSFSPDASQWASGIVDAVSDRHDPHFTKASSLAHTNMGNVDCMGNVSFCDGHAEFFSRKDALRGIYCGNPNPDPVGF